MIIGLLLHKTRHISANSQKTLCVGVRSYSHKGIPALAGYREVPVTWTAGKTVIANSQKTLSVYASVSVLLLDYYCI